MKGCFHHVAFETVWEKIHNVIHSCDNGEGKSSLCSKISWAAGRGFKPSTVSLGGRSANHRTTALPK